MPQSQSQGRQPHRSLALRPSATAEGAGTHDSTSSSQPLVKDTKVDFDALTREVDQLEEERIARIEEYNRLISKAKKTYTDKTSMLKRIMESTLNERKNQIEAERSEDSRAKKPSADHVGPRDRAKAKRPHRVTRIDMARAHRESLRDGASAVQGKHEYDEVTPERLGEDYKDGLADAYAQLEGSVRNICEEHRKTMDELTEKQKKIRETLGKNEIPVPKVSAKEGRAEAADLGPWDPDVYLAEVRKQIAEDEKGTLLKIKETIGG